MIGALFDDAIRSGAPVEVEYGDGERVTLPLDDWSASMIPGDEELLSRCVGATLDVGCGPGRLTVAVAARGLPVLGIDVTPAAVHAARERGALALQRDVFGSVPASGRWSTVLLADGNIGIGGDPATLLRRVRQLLADGGQALVELAASNHGRGTNSARLHSRGRSGEWFRWVEVGVDEIVGPASTADLVVTDRWMAADRHFVVLRPAAAAVRGRGRDR